MLAATALAQQPETSRVAGQTVTGTNQPDATSVLDLSDVIREALSKNPHIAFREDESRVRVGNSHQNFAVLRHIALNLLRQETTATCGIKAKRLKAAWSQQYLLQVLDGLISNPDEHCTSDWYGCLEKPIRIYSN